ncbi:hypothetical protein JXB28_05745 [Candidatus Woesearchaeota archaeon]|nr:hypothetical protein [Candidatus Woesearchaeota archaeon]
MAEDILPPLPPGQKRKTKKKGFLGLFGKAKPAEPQVAGTPEAKPSLKPEPSLKPAAPKTEAPIDKKSAAEKPGVDMPAQKLGQDINDLRKELGLEAHPPAPSPAAEKPALPVDEKKQEKLVAPEPMAVPDKKKRDITQLESEEPEELFDLPELDIPAKQEQRKPEAQPAEVKAAVPETPGEFSFKIASPAAQVDEKEEKPFFSIDDILEKPPSLGDKKKTPSDGSWIKEPEPIKAPAAKEVRKGEDDWTKDLMPGKITKEKSDFIKGVEPDKPLEESHPEFLEELEPDEIKRTANQIKRKEFEAKKGISYEPDVRIIDAPDEDDDDEILLEESPQEEINDIKRRLKMALGQVDSKKEEEVEEPPKIQVTQIPIPAPKASFMAREREEQLAEQIRQQERERIDEEKEELERQAEEEKNRLENERKRLEQEAEQVKALLEQEAEDKKLSLEEEQKRIEEEKRKLQEEAENAKAQLEEQRSQLQAKLEEQSKEEKAKLDEQLKELKEKLEDEYNQKLSELEDIRIKLESFKEKMEKESQQLEQQKIVAAGQMNKNAFKEKQLKAFEIEIEREKKELEMNKQEAEEIIRRLPGLKKEHDELNKKMQKMQDRIQAYENKQRELDDIDAEIRKNQEALIEAQQRLIATEERIKEQGFADYLETEIKKDALVSPKFEEPDIARASNLEFYNLIDNCKSMIREKNLKQAKSSYMQLREAYNTLPVEGLERDMIFTAIRELYDDIKLAEMEGK